MYYITLVSNVVDISVTCGCSSFRVLNQITTPPLKLQGDLKIFQRTDMPISLHVSYMTLCIALADLY